ncbi:hypothetical protein ABZ470_11810 [Streptosporangium sp. NPDC020072]|uniref:hypothetical protein n=1 Tax=Streptosporangium sp. NPDC020072 TaxID=3154788 RepID=UPI003418ED92
MATIEGQVRSLGVGGTVIWTCHQPRVVTSAGGYGIARVAQPYLLVAVYRDRQPELLMPRPPPLDPPPVRGLDLVPLVRHTYCETVAWLSPITRTNSP